MHSFMKIVMVGAKAERGTARDLLRKANTEAPTNREAIAAFLKHCTALDGAPSTLADTRAVAALQ